MRLFLAYILFLSFSGFSQDALFDRYTTSDGLISTKIYDIIETKDKNLWLATDKGAIRFQGLTFEKVPLPQKASQQITGFFIDKQGTLWCHGPQGKLFYQNDSRFKASAINNRIELELGNGIINQVTTDEKGDIWVSNIIGNGLYTIDPISREIAKFKFDTLPNYYVKQLDGESFVTGATQAFNSDKTKLKIYLENSQLEVSLNGNVGFNKSRFIKTKQGNYLFSAGIELINFNKEGILARLFTEKKIECIFEDSEEKLWIGLNQGGVICFPTGDISSGNHIEYLGNRTINCVYEDMDNNLWFASGNSGLFQYSLNTKIAYRKPDFTASNNSNDIRSVQAIRIDNPSPENQISINQTDTIPPDIFISNCKINNKDVEIQESYHLQANENFIRVSFVGSSPNNPGVFQYRYQLEGIDKDWVYTSSSYVQYTMLPPGKYRFKVVAMNNSGIWSQEAANMEFNIQPYFYQTLWFKLTLAAILITIGLLISIAYAHRIRKKERKKAEIDQRIANLELMALRSQMNPHFIFNTLSSIQHFITTNNTEEAVRYLSKFAKLMRTILDNSKHKLITVKNELNGTKLYLELEQLRFKNKFEYQINIDDNVDVENDELPSMLMQPYLENAILHGIAYKEGKGEITINIFIENNYLICCVEDNGIGRANAKKIKEGKSKYHKSRGMSITKDRLDILNKTSNSDLNVEITDLDPNDPINTGTRIKIYIPLNRE